MIAQARASVLQRLETNPVLVKELRARFRGSRAFAIITAFLLVLTGVAYLAYRQAIESWSQASYGSMGVGEASQIGQTIFAIVATIEAVLVGFLGPSLAFNAISGEIERRTFDLLLATPLSASTIIRGKAGAAVAFVVLLISSGGIL